MCATIIYRNTKMKNKRNKTLPMKTRMRKMLLAIVCLLSSVDVSAYDFIVDGIYYDVVSLNDLTCAVTSGDEKYTGDITIPEKVTYKNKELTVTSIGSYAFRGCSGLSSITIPNSVTSIGENAFYDCSGLSNITIPNSVTSIGDGTFCYCSGLSSITIPNSVTSIGSDTFWGCSGLSSITIPNSVTSIDSNAFRGCSGLSSITIPNSVTSIGIYAFSYCSGLSSITIPNSVTSIGDGTFCYCSRLSSINIPNTVTSIGGYAFDRCSGLSSITIPNSVTSIDNNAFHGCSGLKNVTIEDGIEILSLGYNSYSQGEGLFYDCPLTTLHLGRNLFYKIYESYYGISPFYGKSTLTEVTISSSVTRIGKYAFSGCSGLKKVTIEDGIETLSYQDKNIFSDCPLTALYLGRNLSCETASGYSPFYGKSTLTEVYIGNSMTNIYKYAFESCSGLTTLYLLNPIPPNISNDFTNKQYMELNVYVPQGSLSAYQVADVWKDFWELQEFDPTGVETIKANGKKTKDTYHDIQGRKLNAPKNGLNIINGKKVLIRK